MTPRLRVVVAVLAAGLSAGCGSAERSLSGDIALYRSSGDGANAALLEGHLLREGGCTYLHTPEGAVVLPIFPDDARWDGDTLRLGEYRVPLGGEVALSGGEATVDAADYVPDGCDTGIPAWMVGQ